MASLCLPKYCTVIIKGNCNRRVLLAMTSFRRKMLNNSLLLYVFGMVTNCRFFRSLNLSHHGLPMSLPKLGLLFFPVKKLIVFNENHILSPKSYLMHLTSVVLRHNLASTSLLLDFDLASSLQTVRVISIAFPRACKYFFNMKWHVYRFSCSVPFFSFL